MRLLLLMLCLTLGGCQGGCVRWQSESEFVETRRGTEQGQPTDMVVERRTTSNGSATVPVPDMGGIAGLLGGGGVAGLLMGLAAMAVREFSRRGTDKEKERRMTDLEKDRDEGWELALSERGAVRNGHTNAGDGA